jgi:hypothetical protein
MLILKRASASRSSGEWSDDDYDVPEDGLERSRRANWKHGYYSREAKAERSRVRAAILAVRYLRDSI